MQGQTRWQDWANLIFGVWMLLSPAVLAMDTAGAAAWNAYIVGIAVGVIAIIALIQPAGWEEVVNLLLGLWLLASPWIIGFSAVAAAVTNQVIFGLLIVIGAVWALTEVSRQRAPG
ncbi:MAG TPA: SPW repeat protein [Gammaproteobacteria bacterium]|nr:SPW repeat protein [Gammaproteobacteria bacterium]